MDELEMPEGLRDDLRTATNAWIDTLRRRRAEARDPMGFRAYRAPTPAPGADWPLEGRSS